jgi:hypothetical protein
MSETAFSYLTELKKIFTKKYDIKTINNSFAYMLKDFNTDIKRISNQFENNPGRTQKLLETLNESVDILRETAEHLLDRNEKLNLVVNRSKSLMNSSNDLMRSVK